VGPYEASHSGARESGGHRRYQMHMVVGCVALGMVMRRAVLFDYRRVHRDFSPVCAMHPCLACKEPPKKTRSHARTQPNTHTLS
jgi:hypothetical protein